MKLDVARLCLDCEEVHERQHCPSCGSEVFAFLTRWIEPAAELRNDRLRQRPSSPEPPPSGEQLEAYRQLLNGERPRRTSLVAKSVLGLAAFSLAGWAWRSASRPRPSQKEDQAPDAQGR
jgi:hypothetical protein